MCTFLLQDRHLSGQAPLLAPGFEAAQPSHWGHVLDVLDPSPYYVGAVPHRCDMCSQTVWALSCSMCLLFLLCGRCALQANFRLHMSKMLP